MNLRLQYQGWSGCIIQAEEHWGLPQVVIDPAPEATFSDKTMIVLVTHGHPEHIKGVSKHISATGREPISVIGSRSVCNYLRRHSAHRHDRFIPVAAGNHVQADGWNISVFGWRHMGLLPPGLRMKVFYLLKLFSNPLQLLRIVLDGLYGPRHAPMLGYRIEAANGESKPLVYFGEGLHRRTTLDQLESGLGPLPPATLVAAVEPEDVDQLPKLLQPYPISDVLSFEAHRVWRENFGMPQVDITDFTNQMENAGLRYRSLIPGETVQLS